GFLVLAALAIWFIAANTKYMDGEVVGEKYRLTNVSPSEMLLVGRGPRPCGGAVSRCCAGLPRRR
ncbi:hypothetical protein ABZS63_34095, partial [Streptomyces sp. NPDC005568]